MSEKVLRDGDQALFQPTFGAAVVVVRPGRLSGSGPVTIAGRKAAVAGDESRVLVGGCTYITAQHPIPGVGMLKIAGLGADQKATRSSTGGTALLLVGSQFRATFQVQTPAQQPQPTGPPIPDPTPQYSGSGRFVSTNLTVAAL